MNYLRRFNDWLLGRKLDRIEPIDDIDSICNEFGIDDYTINPDGSINVNGDVDISKRKLTRLPLKFGEVSGDFRCHENKLTTLEGCPKQVGVDFRCHENKLTTLEGCPKQVGGDFICAYNELTTLEGCPKQVGGDFICSINKLTTLKNCPKDVNIFRCSKNLLTIINWKDIDGIQCDEIYLEGNPIHQVFKIFPDSKSFINSLEWNYFREPNIIVSSRFIEACQVIEDETGKTILIPEKIEGYIFK